MFFNSFYFIFLINIYTYLFSWKAYSRFKLTFLKDTTFAINRLCHNFWKYIKNIFSSKDKITIMRKYLFTIVLVSLYINILLSATFYLHTITLMLYFPIYIYIYISKSKNNYLVTPSAGNPGIFFHASA